MRRLIPSAALFTAASLLMVAPAAAAPYDDNTVIVKFRSSVAKAERADQLDEAGVRKTIDSVRGIGADVVRVADEPAEVADELERSPDVAYAEPNFVYRTDALPNDARFDDLYALRNVGQTGGANDADMDAPKGWSLAGLGGFPTGGGVRVGLIDTGIDQGHPDLIGRTVACAESRPGGLFQPRFRVGTCEDSGDHGTHLAGTIAAIANNGQGVAGVAFNSRLVMCAAFETDIFGDGVGDVSDIANCIEWVADRSARVINLSFGGPRSETMRRSLDNAWDDGSRSGAVLVAAGGNAGNSAVDYPAGFGNVISVAATTDRDQKASFSNTNSDIELAGAGVSILSTVPGGGYARFSGTSQAAPHVSGVAAVMRDASSSAKAREIRSDLHDAVDDLGSNGRDNRFGYGRVNLCKAAGGNCKYNGPG